MCKHNKNFTIREEAKTFLSWDVEDNDFIGSTNSPGPISHIAIFHCWDCGHEIRFNKLKPSRRYLKNALKKVGLED